MLSFFPEDTETDADTDTTVTDTKSNHIPSKVCENRLVDRFELIHSLSMILGNSWLTAPFGTILWNWKKKLNRKSERFKSFLRPMSQSTASLVPLLSTVCKLKGFVIFSILQIWLDDVISWKTVLVNLTKQRPNSKILTVRSLEIGSPHVYAKIQVSNFK